MAGPLQVIANIQPDLIWYNYLSGKFDKVSSTFFGYIARKGKVWSLRRNYTDEQLATVQDLIILYGHLYYNMGSDIEKEYTSRCGDTRSSGSLYMVAWRLGRGDYIHRGFNMN